MWILARKLHKQCYYKILLSLLVFIDSIAKLHLSYTYLDVVCWFSELSLAANTFIIVLKFIEFVKIFNYGKSTYSIFIISSSDIILLKRGLYRVLEECGTHWTFLVFTTDGIKPRATIKTKTMIELKRIRVS